MLRALPALPRAMADSPFPYPAATSPAPPDRCASAPRWFVVATPGAARARRRAAAGTRRAGSSRGRLSPIARPSPRPSGGAPRALLRPRSPARWIPERALSTSPGGAARGRARGALPSSSRRSLDGQRQDYRADPGASVPLPRGCTLRVAARARSRAPADRGPRSRNAHRAPGSGPPSRRGHLPSDGILFQQLQVQHER